MTMEQRMDQLEKRNKRLTVALTMMAVVMCAVITMAATNIRDISDSEIGRWEFHRDIHEKGIQRHHLLDNVTGDVWRIEKHTKTLVKAKK